MCDTRDPLWVCRHDCPRAYPATEEQAKNDTDFDEWFKQLKEVAMDTFYYTQESVDSFDQEAYRIFYEDGETPKNAMIEELSNA